MARDAAIRARKPLGTRIAMNWDIYLLALPGLVLLIVFRYLPMYGVTIAFKDYNVIKGILGSDWIGLEHFARLTASDAFKRAFRNTVTLSVLRMLFGMPVPILFALLLNELRTVWLKRTIQTLIYLPHFLSWVILGGIFVDVLSPQSGIVNKAIALLGFEPVFFLADRTLFPFVIVATDVWKGFGYGTILYLAAITNIDPCLYESAVIDGAGRWKQILHITVPGMATIIVVLATLSLGNVLNAGFEQVFNLYSPVVYETGDIIDTFVYRIGLVDANYSVATAVGLFKSGVSTVLIVTSYYLAYRFAGYRIF